MSTNLGAGRPPRRIIVGVGAGIAVYKVPAVVRHFVKAGDSVRVMPTEASLNFVGKATWQALSGAPAHTGVFDEEAGVDHVEAARGADLIVIAPATADLIARIHAGLAGDLLTTTVLASTAPVLLVPAMHTAMWNNPATKHNVEQLRARGIHILEPVSGDLSSGDKGAGRMPEPEAIWQRAEEILAAGQNGPVRDLEGVKAFVTAGGTREPIDPVRFVGNHSSGRQGAAIAQALVERGAEVTLFSANVDDRLIPAGVRVVETPSALQMHQAVLEAAPEHDMGFFVAAVADFRPAKTATKKVKKSAANEDGWSLEMVRNPDILAETAKAFPGLLCVGFAAETGSDEEILEFGRAKARSKGAKYIAINRVGGGLGFGTLDNQVVVVDGEGNEVLSTSGSKLEVARAIVALASGHSETQNR